MIHGWESACGGPTKVVCGFSTTQGVSISNSWVVKKLTVLTFIFIYVVYIYQHSYLFIQLWVMSKVFSFSLKDTFSYFFQGRSTSNELPQVCSSENVWISPSFMKDSYNRYRFLGWQFYFFQHFNYVIPLTSDLHISDEKLVVNLIAVLLCVLSYFSCCFQDFLVAFCIWLYDYMSLYGSLISSHLGFVELLGCVDPCDSWNLGSSWTLLIQIFFLPFLSLSPFLDSRCAYMLVCWWCPMVLQGSVYFSSFTFLSTLQTK